MLKHMRWNEVKDEQLNPLLSRKLVVGKELMLARVLLKKGCVVPEHSHVNEQLTYMRSPSAWWFFSPRWRFWRS